MRQREKSHGDPALPETGACEVFGTHQHRAMAHSRGQMWS